MRLVAIVAVAMLGALGAAPASAATPQPSWEQWVHLPGALDVAGPRTDGRLVVAAQGRFALLRQNGEVEPFAPAYAVPDGGEPYIALALGQPVDHTTCRFERDEVLALDVSSPRRGITGITANGTVYRVAQIDGVSSLTGIAMDTVGTFGHRVLVTGSVDPDKTRVLAVDCDGKVTEIVTVKNQFEGGIAVAPRGFGAFGGDLIATNERDGSVYAVSPRGGLRTVVHTDVPAGGDTGVENVGFVPPSEPVAAYLADRGGQGGAHPGDDLVLRLTRASLKAAGLRAGDLVVAAEGGATALGVRCTKTCVSSVIATGPPAAHTEGHIVVAASGSSTEVHGRSWGGVAIGATAAAVATAVVALVLIRRRRAARGP